MNNNPEADVLDAIDELVNEQLAHGPIDDYACDRYPDCGHCPHNWHGIKCQYCSCEASTAEVPKLAYKPMVPRSVWVTYVDQVESVRISLRRVIAQRDMNGEFVVGEGIPELPLELQFPRPAVFRA